MLAARGGHLDLLDDLLAMSGDSVINAKNRFGDTALTLATQENHPQIVARLLKADANFRARNNKGENAQEIAELGKFADIVQLVQTHKSRSGWLSKHF